MPSFVTSKSISVVLFCIHLWDSICTYNPYFHMYSYACSLSFPPFWRCLSFVLCCCILWFFFFFLHGFSSADCPLLLPTIVPSVEAWTFVRCLSDCWYISLNPAPFLWHLYFPFAGIHNVCTGLNSHTMPRHSPGRGSWPLHVMLPDLFFYTALDYSLYSQFYGWMHPISITTFCAECIISDHHFMRWMHHFRSPLCVPRTCRHEC